MTTSNLDFTSGSQSTTGPNVPKGIDYTLPASLVTSHSASFSTSIGTPTGSIPIAGSASVTAGLTGGIDLTLGTYTPNIPVTLNVDLPTSVANGATFTVDPTLASSNDATFSLTGPGAYIALDLAIQGSLGFTFNQGALVEPSFAVNPSFSIGYNLPTSLMISSSKVPGVSLTISEPQSFSGSSGMGSNVTGSIPTLTASGTDSTALVSATADLIHLALDVASTVPGLEELALLDGTYGSSGFASLSYSLISLPLTASLDIGQSVTIVPQAIQVSLTDELSGVTDTGTLGQTFSFTAPDSGSGTIPLQATYTLPIQVESQTGVVGELSLTLKGPQLQGSLLEAGFTVGPVGSYQFFDLSTGLGTVASSNFTQSLTQTATYDVNYGASPCYLAGTRILTDRGEVAVEQLKVGDQVVTASGDLRPVRWLGSRRLDCTRHPTPAEVWPICITADAFAPGRPARDLWVSPGHSVLVEGSLIQASSLVNGATIVQVRRPRVEYWHVELDTHDCIVAEGLPAETYLDTGNRTGFVNGGEFLEAYPDFKPKHFRETCVPLVLEGAAITKARSDLIARAKESGHRMTADADLHLVADGRRIDGVLLGKDRWAFLLNEAATVLELRSRTFVPAHMRPSSTDTRSLGVCVGRLQLDGVDAAFDDATVFGEGWHAVERSSDGHQWRWTHGCTSLPKGTRLVVVSLSGPSHYWEQRENAALARVG